MYMQNDIVADGAQRWRIDPPRVDAAALEAELDRTVAAASEATPSAIMDKLSSFSVSLASEGHGRAQIRSEPIGATGCEFRFDIPMRNTPLQDVEPTAKRLVDAAVATVKSARRWASATRQIRDMAESLINEDRGGISRMRVIAVGVCPIDRDRIATIVDVETLGRDLRPAVHRISALDVAQLAANMKPLVEAHRLRRDALAQAVVSNASGWIDHAALRILDRAGMDRAEIVELLRGQREVEFSLPNEDGDLLIGSVYWADGIIMGYVESRELGATFRLESNQLLIEPQELPAAIVASLPGRRLRQLVDIDFVPPDALILDVLQSSDWMMLDLEFGRSTIEDALCAPR